MRGAQLYDSIIVRKSDKDASAAKKEHKSQTDKADDEGKPSIVMPGEMGGTMSKAMSYDVNPIYSL